MESMEVDLPVELQVAGGEQPGINAAEQFVISDSGSSTEIDEDEDDGDIEGRVLSRLLPTWAFSQRVATVTSSASQGAPLRRRLRQGLRVHYPSQTAASFRGFPDFLLRVPAANVDATESGSATDISESENEAVGDEGNMSAAAAADSAASADPVQPAVVSVQQEEPQHINPTDAPSASVSDTINTATENVQSSLSASQKSNGEETEGDICTICFEAWTTAGEHRLSALRCGHLFGYTCIQRWLKSQRPNAKCPQCNKKAKHSDIVLLYAPKLRALDNTEQESLKRFLEQEQCLRRKAELEMAQCKLKLQVITSQYGQAQKELQELKALMAQSGKSSTPCSSTSSSLLSGLSQRADGLKSANYNFSKAVLVSQAGGCRVMSYCEPLSCLLASQPSAHATLLPGYGVKKVSMMNMKANEYVPIHSKQIRGLSFNRQNDSLLLSAALDNTIKLTSLLTNTVVQTYNAGKPVWSCCWCLDNTNYIYAGLNNGSVYVYDTRDTSTHVKELEPLRPRCPVASLCYIPRSTSSSFPCGGLIAGTLDSGTFWEQENEAAYKPHILPLENGCIDIQVETESRHCLVTYRPGRSKPMQRCVLMALSRTPLNDSHDLPECSCSPVQTFNAGSSCKLLTKNAVFRCPDGERTLVCAGEEATNCTLVWDASSGFLLQKLPADLPVLDISPFSVNGEHFLASLTEKMLKLYRWQ